MAKTYNSFTNVSDGDVYTATAHNNILANVNNYRVPPICRVQLTSAQSIANNATKDIVWASESFDTEGTGSGGMFTASSASVTIQTAGIYVVCANVMFSPSAAGVRQVVVTRNATADSTNNIIAGSYGAGNATVNNAFAASCVISLAVNDVIKVNVFQNTGSALDVLADAYTAFSATWLGQVS